jgi:subfamily B ATP-binding cassette protein MsbA
MAKDFRRLFTYLKPHTGLFILATLAMLATGLLHGGIGALVVPIFDQAFSNPAATVEAPTPTLFNLQQFIPTQGFAAWRAISILLLVFTFAKAFTDYFSRYLMARIGQLVVRRLRDDLFRHILAQSAGFFERHRTNYLVSRLLTSTAAIESLVTSILRDLLMETVLLVVFLSACVFYSWRLTLTVAIVAPLVGMITAHFGRRLRNLARESLEGGQRMNDTAQEALANNTIVKAYTAERREESRFRIVLDEIVNANLRAARISGFAPQLIEIIGVVAVVVLLFFGQREIAAGRMTSAQFLTFLIFLFRSYDPIRKLSRLHNAAEQALAGARQVWEVIDEHCEMPEKSDALPLVKLERAIRFENVSFRYRDDARPVLESINLEVPLNRMIALVGESGGGKSTLTKLVPRLHDPTHGRVTWDGVDLRDVRVADLRRQIAIVTQETILFNNTVRYNIAYSRPDASDEDIKRAARIAFADNFIEQLSAGYDTLVGERGVFLSGGQRQRLAIARAVLADAPVLVLDEATSALDTESERLVQQALQNLMQHRTTICIAHRLSTVRRADAIVVIERGRIIELAHTRNCSTRAAHTADSTNYNLPKKRR